MTSSPERKVVNLHPMKRSSLMTPGTTTPIPPHLANASLRIALTAFCLGSLAGLTLPKALTLFSSISSSDTGKFEWHAWRLWQNATQPSQIQVWQLPQLHFYLLAWSLFHMTEFVITARWNNTRLYSDCEEIEIQAWTDTLLIVMYFLTSAFLIQNGIGYLLAHLFGIAEFLVEAYVYPQVKVTSLWTGLGVSVLLLGQVIRSLAMIQAGNNFSHQVADKKRDDHQLVTEGLYAYMRHPSYFGFFYWALGTQIVLCNPIGTVAFAFVLWRFFSNRIQGEEEHLIEFFGDQYIQYRKTTRTLIPFIA